MGCGGHDEPVRWAVYQGPGFRAAGQVRHGRVTVAVVGRLDSDNAAALSEVLDAVLSGDWRDIRLEMTEVGHLGPAVVGVLRVAASRAAADGKRFVVRYNDDPVGRRGHDRGEAGIECPDHR